MTRYSKVIEADSESLLKEGVVTRGGLCLKVVILGAGGFPDRLLFMPGGKFYLVELKKLKGWRFTIAQKIMFPLIEKRGFKIHVLHGNVEVQTFLDSL